jgi:hypothetical protein
MTPAVLAEQLARQMLESGVSQWEKIDESNLNIFSIHDLAGAARLLSEEDLCLRAAHLLPKAPLNPFRLPGNFKQFRKVPPLRELKKRYPTYDKSLILSSVYKPSPHIVACLEGRYEDAVSQTHKELDLEEVGATLAIMGEFEWALRVAGDEKLPAFRQRGVLMVLVIEMFRYGRLDQFQEIFAEFEASGIGPDMCTWLARGFMGRLPWVGYPYPDW